MMVMNSSWEMDPSELRSSLLNSSSALDWSALDPTISYTAKIVLRGMSGRILLHNGKPLQLVEINWPVPVNIVPAGLKFKEFLLKVFYSYILKAQPSFSSAVPDEVTWRANINSDTFRRHISIRFRRSTSKVDGATAICVESPEDNLTELVSTASREYFVVHFNKLILGKLPVWAVLHKASMPFLR